MFFNPSFCSLLRPHPILYTASHSYEVNKMVVQLRLLSGRARLGTLLRHFNTGNTGVCELCCTEVEDLTHFLLPRCPKLQERSDFLINYMQTLLGASPVCQQILDNVILTSRRSLATLKEQEHWVQFVLDCSVLPSVVEASRADASVLPLLFKITRTWCYSLHRTRLKLLGRWSFK